MALVTADAVQDKKESKVETKQIEQAESQKTEKRGLHHSLGDYGGHDFGGHDFGGHDFGGGDHGHEEHHHHEHVKTITIEKKVPVPYTVHKHVPYTVEKKVPYTVHVPVPQVKYKLKIVSSQVLIRQLIF